MKITTTALACLALVGCGSKPDQSANAVAATPDAVTTEAVEDVRAAKTAESEAVNAADAELDNLSNSIDDAGNGVSNSTAVMNY